MAVAGATGPRLDVSRSGHYGVLIQDLPIPLLARTVLVVDPSDTIRYIEIVPEIAQRYTVSKNGKVVLSLHYQAGLVASPARVKVDGAPGAREDGQPDVVVSLQFEDIPLVRLRVSSPVAHLTLVWQK